MQADQPIVVNSELSYVGDYKIHSYIAKGGQAKYFSINLQDILRNQRGKVICSEDIPLRHKQSIGILRGIYLSQETQITVFDQYDRKQNRC